MLAGRAPDLVQRHFENDVGKQQHSPASSGWDCLAAPQGFEPRYADPESAVLPLNEGATSARCGSSCSRLAGAPERDAQSQPLHVTGISPSGQFPGCGLPDSRLRVIRRSNSNGSHPVPSLSPQISRSQVSAYRPGRTILRAALRAAAVRECGSLQSSPSPLPAKPFPKAQSPLRPTRC